MSFYFELILDFLFSFLGFYFSEFLRARVSGFWKTRLEKFKQIKQNFQDKMWSMILY